MVLWKTGKYRSQSAMEYLMTYGWAILIIAVVLGVLFQLGVFNGSNFSSGVCLPISGYLCSNPLLSSSGTLSMTFGYQGQNFTVDGYSCSSSAQAPSSSSFTSSGTSKLQPGQEESITVNCPVSSGAVIGTPFSGYLWIEYNQGGKDDLITQFASIQIKVDTNQVFGAGCSGTVLEYVPISIDNTNTVDATPSTFQQLLSVDTSPYGANTFSDLSNACFSTGPNGSGSELQAWVESISGTTATVWVELTSSIPASGTQNIYMNLMAANDISSSGPIGEAPTLSATYGEYDNGASVFSFYDNFAGSSLSSLWSFVQTGGYGSYVVNNGITLSSSSGSGWVGPGILSTSTFNPASSVEDIHATGISGSGDFAEDWIYPAPTNSCAGANGLDCSVPGGTTEGYAMMYRIWTGTWAFQGYGPGGVDNQNEQGCSGATPPTSLEWNPSLATVEEGLQNYNGCLSGPSAADAPMQNSYVFVVVQYDPTSVTVQWVRVRAMPPGGMMPSPTLGSPVMG